jgi:hypothetical protein
MDKQEFINEIASRGTINLAEVPNGSLLNLWCRPSSSVLDYATSPPTSYIRINGIDTTNPPSSISDIVFYVYTVGKWYPVDTFPTDWLLTRINELPFGVAPPIVALAITKAEISTDNGETWTEIPEDVGLYVKEGTIPDYRIAVKNVGEVDFNPAADYVYLYKYLNGVKTSIAISDNIPPISINETKSFTINAGEVIIPSNKYGFTAGEETLTEFAMFDFIVQAGSAIEGATIKLFANGIDSGLSGVTDPSGVYSIPYTIYETTVFKTNFVGNDI